MQGNIDNTKRMTLLDWAQPGIILSEDSTIKTDGVESLIQYQS